MDLFQMDIPKDVATLTLPDPELLAFYQDLDNRIIWIDSEIGDGSLLYVIRKILQYNAADKKADIQEKDRKPIRIFIDSPGGDIQEMYSLVDVMELSRTPIYTYNVGSAASAAGIVLMAGHTRYSLSNAIVLVHRGSAQFAGNANDLETGMESYKKQLERLKALIISKTSITTKLINQKFKADWWLTAEEALNLNVIDKIVDSMDDLI